MHKLGLKLWSINTDFYYDEAIRLYKNKIFDYVELYVVPKTINTLEKWKKLDIPFIIHNAHFAQGFNLANKDKRDVNKEIYLETKIFADELGAKSIIFHGGIDGDIKETARQLASFNEPRALIENKPFLAVPNIMHGEYCRGYNLEEIKYVKNVANCGFCFDIGHCVCSAISQNFDIYGYVEKFLELKPNMYHLTDNIDLSSPYDSHLHLGTGELDIKRVLNLLPKDSTITLETDKNSPKNLDDFISDAKYVREYENS